MLDVRKIITILALFYFDSIGCINETSKQGQLIFAHVVSEI